MTTDDVAIYPQFGTACNLLDKLASNRFPTAVRPLVSAHAEAAIPLTELTGEPLTLGDADRSKSFDDTVRDYLKAELTNHAEDERAAILDRAEALLQEMT